MGFISGTLSLNPSLHIMYNYINLSLVQCTLSFHPIVKNVMFYKYFNMILCKKSFDRHKLCSLDPSIALPDKHFTVAPFFIMTHLLLIILLIIINYQ